MTAINLVTIDSPCVGVCTMQNSGYCLGCWRTMDEISNWVNMNDQQRKMIMQQTIPERQQVCFDD